MVPLPYMELKRVQANLSRVEKRFSESQNNRKEKEKKKGQERKMNQMANIREGAITLKAVPEFRLWTPELLEKLDTLVTEVWPGANILYMGLQHPTHEKAMSLYTEKAVAIVEEHFQHLLETQPETMSSSQKIAAMHAAAKMQAILGTRACDVVGMPILTDKVFLAIVERLRNVEPATREVSVVIDANGVLLFVQECVLARERRVWNSKQVTIMRSSNQEPKSILWCYAAP